MSKRAEVLALVSVLVGLAPVTTYAAPVQVDLTGWTENGLRGNNDAGNWTVQPGNDEVLRTFNGQPSAFFAPGANDQGSALRGTIRVETSSDDDFIGFILGYQDAEFNSTSADFWLIDWKQGDQSLAQNLAVDGLALSHVTGDVANTLSANDFWEHTGTVNEVQRGLSLGSTGWVDNTEYDFDLSFTDSLIEVKVNGTTELSYTSALNGGNPFTDGAFGFYNYSQSNVRYAGLTEEVLPPASPIPLPASLPLLLAGIGGLAFLRRRKT